MNPYACPDHHIDDTDADDRDANDLRKEAEVEALTAEMLGDDGDISEVLELLIESPENVLRIMKAYHHGLHIGEATLPLAFQLDALLTQVVEEKVYGS